MTICFTWLYNKVCCVFGAGNSLASSTLICVDAQGASGMAYLEANNYIHRNLTARNTSLGPNKVCKDAGLRLAFWFE